MQKQTTNHAWNETAADFGLGSLLWIRWVATLSSLIALGGLLFLAIQNSYAETGGFQPGGKTFQNPYAPPSGSASPFFDDDEMDDEGGSAPTYSPPGAGGAADDGAPRGSAGGISIGGNPNAVKEGAKSAAQPFAKVDDEGANGSKEVITDFNFPDADILDIAKALGKLTGKSFLLDKDVKGRVTIITNAPVTVTDAWRAFLTALDMNGFALIPSGKFIRIARQRDARDKQLKTYTGNFSPNSDALITRLFPLKYLSAEEVARNFRSFMPANSRIIPYEQTNTVIVTDTGSNIAKLSKLLDILDVEGYDAGIEVIPVKFASATELAKLIDTLIPGTGGANGAVGGPRFPGAGGGRFTARRTKEGGIINTIISDDRTNNLIVHANTKGADQVRELVTKLDKKLPPSLSNGKINVVYLQFADAESIAATLNNITSGSGSGANRPVIGGGFGGLGGGGAGSTGTNPLLSNQTLFEGQIKLAADKSTNSIVITASPADFATIQSVIYRLDVPRDQVYSEVYIVEVGVQRNFEWSANILAPTSGLGMVTSTSDLGSFINNPVGVSGAILGFKSGGSKTITVGGQSVQVSSVQGLIRFLQTNINANVVATPQILTLDNTEATFESSEKVPVKKTTISNGTPTTSFEPQPVSIAVTLKPSINKLSNFLKLKIDTKMEDFSNRKLPAAVENEAIATYSRQAKTEVIVGDGDTVVLGGLVRDVSKDTTAKIPVLGDIPVLGWLFKSKNTEVSKTNTLIFITPKIIRPYENVRAILDRKLKERDDFLEKSTGGEDLGREYRDQIIRNLPDIKKFKGGYHDAAASAAAADAATLRDGSSEPAAATPASASGNHRVEPIAPPSDGAAVPPGGTGAFAPGSNPYAAPGDLPPPPTQ